MNMRNNTAATNRRASTRLFAISVLLALAAILAISSAAPAAVPAAAPAAVPAQVGTMDYDTDDDGYIEVNNLAKLNAIRWDLDGDGDVASGNAANYLAAFVARDTNAATRMGCPGGACVGYELMTNLDFDSDNDGDVDINDHSGAYWDGGDGWEPIGDDGSSNRYTGNFNGNGYEVRNLFIDENTANYKGLFGAFGSGARIESLGVTDANVTGASHVGILSAVNRGTIVACYTTGSATASTNNAGGLVAYSAGTVTTSYSRASASAPQRVGGLIGEKPGAGSVINSYSTGNVTRTGSGAATTVGGLIGTSGSGSGTITNSYWDTTTSTQSGSAGGGGQTTTALQGGTTYTGIFSDWNINLDGVAGNDDPWDFKGASAYPELIYHLTDYDTDEDGLIEISNHAQLNAIRLNLNGRGDSLQTAYGTAFPNRSTSSTKYMGCPSGPCSGYELVADIDLDTNGNGIVGTGDTADAYYNSGNGWDPLGSDTSPGDRWATTFKGNGHTISNLFINRSTGDIGLFGSIHDTARIESLGVTNANVTGADYVGILVGSSYGTVVACYTTGAVTSTGQSAGNVGGLVGYLDGRGSSSGAINSTYSTASVTAYRTAGGLVGYATAASITNSYSTGTVTRTAGSPATSFGGLLGWVGSNSVSISASYWNTQTSGRSNDRGTDTLLVPQGTVTGGGAEGKTTAELQAPTDYGASSGDIYYGWDANIDGQAGNDDPWDFGGATDYPLLKYGGHTTFKQGRGDFDDDNDGYIDITTLAQLDAVRHDLDTNGTPAAGAGTTAYNAAFPSRETGAANLMGCPAGACTGYELLNDLDFDENGDGSITSDDAAYWNSGDGWSPIGGDFTGKFKGNGNTINNLYITRTSAGQGLFNTINHANARIETLGVTNATVTIGNNNHAGIIASRFYRGDIVACYTSGEVESAQYAGGIVGTMGVAGQTPAIHSSYSTAYVRGGAHMGGVVGRMVSGSITNSYATGRVTSEIVARGGLVGTAVGGSATASYWDTVSSQQATSARGTAKTTAELQSVTGYTGIYAAWNADIDDVTGNDDPWNFCTAGQYPTLKYGGHDPLRQSPCGDYDLDDDGYIDVANLAQLAAMDHDLNGNGDATAAGYIAAFPNRITAAAARMGCPSGTCTGYELVANLDFDSDGDGDVDANDHGGAYWNGGAGWDPIGSSSARWATNFRGNGHTINNLFISRSGSGTNSSIALFARSNSSGTFESVGVINANVTGRESVGILVGENSGGSITACYTTGRVAGAGSNNSRVGGLTGLNSGSIRSSYSTASVSASQNAGGLVAYLSSGSITDSYSTGRVTASSNAGGLIGTRFSTGTTVSNSYWDTVSSGQSISAGSGAVGKTPRELQTVTGYTGIYANWNANLDGEAGNDDPWHFGNGMQYPMLDYKGMPTAPQGGLAMGIPDNWNAPVAGERLGVCLVDGPSMRGIVPGQTYLEAWVWERSSDGATWTVISGAGDGASPPTYEYSPTATDVDNFIRAKVKLTDGSFAHTRALGGRVIAATDAAITASGVTAGDEIAFINGHAAPQVGRQVVATNVLLPGDRDVRSGWQRCPNNTAPHSDCVSIPLRWQVSYTPVAADVGNYLRYYVYYETAAGEWTRRVTPFTTGVVAAASP